MNEQRLEISEGVGEDVERAEGCGCIGAAPPPSADAPSTPPTTSDPPTSAGPAVATAIDLPSTADMPRRPLKLVVTVQPVADGGYHAVLALGSEGCDPLIRVLDATDLPTVLNAVPTLVAEAHARWQTQPRHPSVRPATRAKPTKEEPAAAPSVSADRAETAPVQPTPPVPPTTSAKPSSGQLSLFG